MKLLCIWAMLGCIILVEQVQPVGAQQSQGTQQAPALQQGNPQAGGIAIPDVYRLNMMIRSSIIALNQANETGNYTVLLDLAAPSFRAANDSRRLAQIFGKLRQRNIDLSPILFFTPKLLQQPQITPDGLLRMVGYFPTAPERVNFDLYFQMVAGKWKLFGIGVDMSPADVTAAIASNGQGNNAPPPNRNGGRNPGASGGSQANSQTAKETAPGEIRNPVVANAPVPERKPINSGPARNGGDGATQTVVENSTTNNATRIDLSQSENDTSNNAEPELTGQGSADSGKSIWQSFNPFSSE